MLQLPPRECGTGLLQKAPNTKRSYSCGTEEQLRNTVEPVTAVSFKVARLGRPLAVLSPGVTLIARISEWYGWQWQGISAYPSRHSITNITAILIFLYLKPRKPHPCSHRGRERPGLGSMGVGEFRPAPLHEQPLRNNP